MFQRTRFSGACRHVKKVALHMKFDSKPTVYNIHPKYPTGVTPLTGTRKYRNASLALWLPAEAKIGGPVYGSAQT